MRSHVLFARLLAGLVVLWLAGPAQAEAPMAAERRTMVAEIEAIAAAVGVGSGRRGIAAPVLAALNRLPRHEFVPPGLRGHAYANRPLPIGYGQTISQPFIVAAMTELLQVGRGDRILEIGTGSGYQAAVLAELGAEVATIEIVDELGREAAERLRRLGYAGVSVKVADGYHGWPEKAPFDAIVVTAAASHVPPPLLRQLKPGGRMVIPVGPAFQTQQLMLVEKQADGAVLTRQLMAVSFVPLTGGHD